MAFGMLTALERADLQAQARAIVPAVLADDQEALHAWLKTAPRRAIANVLVEITVWPAGVSALNYLVQALQTPAYLTLADHARRGELDKLNAFLMATPPDPYDADWALRVALGMGQEACAEALWDHADFGHPRQALESALHAKPPVSAPLCQRLMDVVFAEAQVSEEGLSPSDQTALRDFLPRAARTNHRALIPALWNLAEAGGLHDLADLLTPMLCDALRNDHLDLARWLIETRGADPEAAHAAWDLSKDEEAAARLNQLQRHMRADQRAMRAGDGPGSRIVRRRA